MKKLMLVLIAAILAMLLGCPKNSDSPTSSTPTPAPCAVTGTNVNIGSTTGGSFAVDLGSSNLLYFSNTSLNFQPVCQLNCTSTAKIVDVGAKSCLESITSWPGGTATLAAYTQGHGYIVQYINSSITTYARFIANSYSGGIVSITYQYPFTVQ